MSKSLNHKIPQYRINVTVLNSKTSLVQNNDLYIPVYINKEQEGTGNLYNGKVIYIFIHEITVKTIYTLKPDNTEYLKVDNIDVYNNIEFLNNDIFQYNEIDLVKDDYAFVTLSDIKLKLKATKNGVYNGASGLLEPIHLRALEEIKYFRNLTTKTLNNLNNGISLMFVEKSVTETSFDLSFGLSHSLFNLQYDLKIFGDNFLIKTNKFSTGTILSGLNLELSVNKIISNDGTKTLYQLFCKFTNLPSSLLTNPEVVNVQYSEDIINKNVTATSPTYYILSNYTAFISPKLFTRTILYHDINGPVNVNINESIKLNSLDNLININNIGWYHYDVLNVNDPILTGLPNGLKNIFNLQVKRLSNEINVQYLFVLDTTKNEVRSFSRFRNNNTLLFSSWVEYVTQNHKHPAIDIITDSNRLFVSQTQIDLWNSFSASLTDYWNDAVLNKTDLPIGNNQNGECRYVISENKIYSYFANDNAWRSVTDVKITYEVNTDYLKIKINGGTGTNQEIVVPEVTETTPGIVSPAVISDYKGFFESKLNFTTENTGTGIPTAYEKPLEYTVQIYENDSDMIYDGATNYLFGLNGSTRIIDLSNIATKIKKTLFTKTDNDNIFTGIVKDYQFVLVTNNYIDQKIIFGTGKTVSIMENGQLLNHTQNELILSQTKNYIVKINDMNIKLYSINKG